MKNGTETRFGFGGTIAGDQAKHQASVLVCFCHLRWDFVWQRPQHLLSRFAAKHGLTVYVVEEPEFVAGDGVSDLRVVERDGVTVVTPLLPATPEPMWGFNDTTNPIVRGLLAPFFAERGLLSEPRHDALGMPGVIAWYYTPMALGVEPAGFDPALVVFDAMDELASFRGASRSLREREAATMARADVVFAGGPSLYEARKDRHPRVACFPSGVEPAHFAQAANGIARPADLDLRPRPILGFYGVLDERVDFDLVAAVADARPAWTLAMIGPLAKITEADLPRRPNIVYYGKQAYRDLPAYLACFDVAILPFARNEATRFISPTKTLEYMAGEKPIVSTPIKDVIDLYGSVVAFGETPETFVAGVERALAETPADRVRRLTASRAILARSTWDAIADRMWALMSNALAEHRHGAIDRTRMVLATPAAGIAGRRSAVGVFAAEASDD